MPALKAREQLDRITAAAIPHMKSEVSGPILDRLQEQLGEEETRPRRATTADFVRLGIPIKRVPKKKS